VNYVAGEQDPYVTLVQAAAEHLAAGNHRRRVGLNHLAFRARSRAHVDEVRSWVREAEVRSHHRQARLGRIPRFGTPLVGATVAAITARREGGSMAATLDVGPKAIAILAGALVDLLDAPPPDEDVPAPPRLLAMWDSVLLAYADRSRVIPEAYRPHVIRRDGGVLPATCCRPSWWTAPSR